MIAPSVIKLRLAVTGKDCNDPQGDSPGWIWAGWPQGQIRKKAHLQAFPSAMNQFENIEDILSDSLEFLGGEQVVDDGRVHYGPLSLTVAPKANSLLADQIFSPSLLIAERIERGLVPASGCSVIELGAGCALPSLLMATLFGHPSVVVVTDYPDDVILGNLEQNVKRNQNYFQSGCSVHCIGYEWGKDVRALLKFVPSDGVHPAGYDIVIMSDLLHFHTSHDALLLSLTSLLSKSKASRVYVAAGNYTPLHVCDNFLRQGERLGIIWQEGEQGLAEAEWHGTVKVSGLDKAQLAVRKNVCRWWLGRWAEFGQ